MLIEYYNDLIIETSKSRTANPVLDSIKKELLDRIDNSTDTYVIQMRNKMKKTIAKMKIAYSSEHESFYDDYSEVTLYFYLQDKGLNVIRINEIPHKKTPDFEVKYGSERIFVENKCIKPMNPQKNVTDFQNNVLDSNIELDYRAKKPGVSFGEPVCYQPYLPNDPTKYKSLSNLLVIQSIIEKVNQNFKEEQINEKTVLNVDLTLLGLNSIPTTAAFILDTQDDIVINAPLWTSCFGRIGMPIFMYEFAPHGNFEGYLEKEGILISNPNLNAISFRFDKWTDPTFYGGFVRTMKDCKPDYHDILEDFLQVYCNELNTQHNSNYECFRQ